LPSKTRHNHWGGNWCPLCSKVDLETAKKLSIERNERRKEERKERSPSAKNKRRQVTALESVGVSPCPK